LAPQHSKAQGRKRRWKDSYPDELEYINMNNEL